MRFRIDGIKQCHVAFQGEKVKAFHFLLSRINKLDRDFLYWQIFSLVCPPRNHVTLLVSH